MQRISARISFCFGNDVDQFNHVNEKYQKAIDTIIAFIYHKFGATITADSAFERRLVNDRSPPPRGTLDEYDYMIGLLLTECESRVAALIPFTVISATRIAAISTIVHQHRYFRNVLGGALQRKNRELIDHVMSRCNIPLLSDTEIEAIPTIPVTKEEMLRTLSAKSEFHRDTIKLIMTL